MRCEQQGCERDATHLPKCYVPSIGFDRNQQGMPAILLFMNLCHEHTRTFDLKGMLEATEATPNKLRTILAIASQPHFPDFSQAFVVPIRIDSEEVQAYERARQEAKRKTGGL